MRAFLFSTSIAALFISIFFIEGCSDFFKEVPVKKENISLTTLKFTFTNQETNRQRIFYYRNINQYGIKKGYQVDTIYLDTKSIYSAKIECYDERNGLEFIDHTKTIQANSRNYLVCLNSTTTNYILRTDNDGQFPLGLQSRWINEQKSQGKLAVTIKYQPNIKNGECSIGESLIDVDLPIVIK